MMLGPTRGRDTKFGMSGWVGLGRSDTVDEGPSTVTSYLAHGSFELVTNVGHTIPHYPTKAFPFIFF